MRNNIYLIILIILVILIIKILILKLSDIYKLNINKYNKKKGIENFNDFYEKLVKKNPELQIETGYNPSIFTDKFIPNDYFDKYNLNITDRNLKEFSDIVYLGNPL